MTIVQFIALTVLIISALGLVVGFVWIMLLTRGQSVEISFSEIKRAFRARMFRRLAPVALCLVSIFFIMFAIAFVMLAFNAPLIVVLIWLGASIYSVVRTVRAFARV